MDGVSLLMQIHFDQISGCWGWRRVDTRVLTHMIKVVTRDISGKSIVVHVQCKRNGRLNIFH